MTPLRIFLVAVVGLIALVASWFAQGSIPTRQAMQLALLVLLMFTLHRIEKPIRSWIRARQKR